MLKTEMEIPDSDKLLYRNQFVLGPFYIKGLTSWKRIKINKSIHLTVHPDLSIYQANYDDKSITLLGFILDPESPQASDCDIINRLIIKLISCDNCVKQTYNFGGRWIIIVNDGKKLILFNDAAGLRQVFYTRTQFTNDLWCASQPGIIAEILHLEMDKDAIHYINSYEFRKNTEFRWPGDNSPYKEIKHLLPNHYLDLETGLCQRYWPDKPLDELSINEALRKTSITLKALMKSACNRFDLALSLTAGLDSRLVLAASKEISDNISYMTVRQIDKPDDHADITIPSLLLSELGLKHDIVRSSYIINDDFLKAFKKNAILAHYIYAPDAQAILDYYSQKKVAVTGSVSEIARWSFRSQLNKPDKENVTPYDLSRLQKMGKNQYAINCFDNWLSQLEERHNLHILDMFEWEQGHGNWLAMCQSEFDIAWKDIFTPFNCRNLLMTMLSVNEKYRKPPKYELYEKLLFNLWPELLNVPINPHTKPKKKAYWLVSSYVPSPVKRRIKRVFKLENRE